MVNQSKIPLSVKGVQPPLLHWVMLGNTPIIIDEPEAHLDSNLIAKYLVELVKTVKKNRQIIFATHNANFVVNGDSELIHILTMSDSKVTNSCETSIENMRIIGSNFFH